MINKLSKIRTLFVLLTILAGWASVPASLAFGSSGNCQMACCLVRDKGGDEVASCPAHKHRAGGGRSGAVTLQAEMEAPCSSNCGTPASSARFFPSGINREITRLINLSDSADPLPEELELLHNPLRFAPAPTRAPPSAFA